ncbi:uncharacterized protein MELLADRAFT_73364 [Melampsora larici-populina 98AG31]|uniref:Heme haloperoxidase family profile domain-containing protein n=1 Tax=Melampsora larici-populina (strain 98AG31 / pathotype 3-4-7) TaxID=747676 RepID=F4S713_MELLP|nr:uncharacterized protein MELLADRAFT_73364 [Melampsora larici-populina 98AG31]EGF99555.1 hypothetical protein MELLADRAFT_73364 [Melampsora larici-populina 98AG31]
MLLSLSIVLLSLLKQGFAFHIFETRTNRASPLSTQATDNLLRSQVLSDFIPTTLDLGPTIASGRKRIPDDDHPFQSPGPTDIRGGCPGLNIMANYGYISRNGITNVSELMYGMQEMLGFGPDISAVIVALGVKASFDLTSLKTSIGQTDSRTDGPNSALFGTAPGFFSKASHNKFEVDGSLSRVDGYFAKGNTDRFDSDHWKKYRKLAVDKFGGLTSIDFDGAARFEQYKECREKNPQCQWAVGEQFPLYIAQAFVGDTMTSADANGNLLPPDVKSIQTFFGIIENSDGTFSRGDNKLPPGPDGFWYRRTVPLSLPQQAATLNKTYLAYPVEFGRNNGTLGSWNSDSVDLRNIEQIGAACYLLQQIRNPQYSRYTDAATINKLGILLNNTLQPAFQQLGCE